MYMYWVRVLRTNSGTTARRRLRGTQERWRPQWRPPLPGFEAVCSTLTNLDNRRHALLLALIFVCVNRVHRVAGDGALGCPVGSSSRLSVGILAAERAGCAVVFLKYYKDQ